MDSSQNIELGNVESVQGIDDISFEEYDCDGTVPEYLVEHNNKNKMNNSATIPILLNSNGNNINDNINYNKIIDSLSDIRNFNQESIGDNSEPIIFTSEDTSDANSILENILRRKSTEEEEISDITKNIVIEKSFTILSDNFNEDDSDLNPINVENLINIYDATSYENISVKENHSIQSINKNTNTIIINDDDDETQPIKDVVENDSLYIVKPQPFLTLRVKSPTKLIRSNLSENSKDVSVLNETHLKDALFLSQDQNNDVKIVLVLGNDNEIFCNECYLSLKCKFMIKYQKKDFNICGDLCLTSFCVREKIGLSNNKVLSTLHLDINVEIKPTLKNIQINLETENSISTDLDNKDDLIRKCGACLTVIDNKNSDIVNWQIMVFCNEICLEDYQIKLYSFCGFCKSEIHEKNFSKYCVRFGSKINQFCNATCLEKYKIYAKICSYCQKGLSNNLNGFCAPIGNKFKDFCSSKCMEMFDFLINRNTKRKIEIGFCSVCNEEKQLLRTYETTGNIQKFCCDPCFVAFKFVNKLYPLQCITCKKFYKKINKTDFAIYYDSNTKHFCSDTCQNVFILCNRKIMHCNWCKVSKYNFDLIQTETSPGQPLYMCSLHCLRLFKESINTIGTEKQTCSTCMHLVKAEFHLTLSDSTIRSFCNTKCVNYFLQKFTNVKVTDKSDLQNNVNLNQLGYLRGSISSTNNISALKAVSTSLLNRPGSEKININPTQVLYYPCQNPNPNNSNNTRQVIIKPLPHPIMKNKTTSCKPITYNKSLSCKPRNSNKRVQTDHLEEKNTETKTLIPIPVPIYVPTPMPMYRQPIPITIPFPIPIPIPVFIPTIRNSLKGIMKELKKIREKFPDDPLEAEMVQMAKLVDTNENKIDCTDSESDENENNVDFVNLENDKKNIFDDNNQRSIKNDEPNIDLESTLTANEISLATLDTKTEVDNKKTRSKYQRILDVSQSDIVKHESNKEIIVPKLKRKSTKLNKENIKNAKLPNVDNRTRSSKRAALKSEENSENKRPKVISNNIIKPSLKLMKNIEFTKTAENLCLKYLYGVNAWKQWIAKKNSQLEKSEKVFSNDILELTSNELNLSLCAFIQEIQKPNGEQYAPDTIYYLCLGIQLYLIENGRTDNIFSDSYYKNFIDTFDVVSKKFATLYDDSNFIVTRVEEEYLWESLQLGVFSPYTLLNTLIYFNTLHFNMTTVEDHLNISFLHIVKCVKGNSKIASLRCYPRLNSSKKAKKLKFYEIFGNKKNIYRCPIKLYDFYLNKCPDCVKKRDDLFYLLPERSCVADSPVWFSTNSLDKEDLEKILRRVKMVREINEALLASRDDD